MTSRKVQILWVVDVSKPSSTPNNFSLHNINYRKLCFIEKYTNNSETKWMYICKRSDSFGHLRQIVLDTKNLYEEILYLSLNF